MWDAKGSGIKPVAGVVVLALVAFLAIAAGAAAAPPTVSIDPTATGGYNTAEVSGTIDPKGAEGNYTFEISTDGITWSDFNYEGYLPPGSGPTKVSNTIGAKPGTEFQVRLVALISGPEGGEFISAPPNPTFKTKPVAAPVVTFAQPSAVTGTTAHFSGTIRPEADPTKVSAFDVTWYFECTPECPDLPSEIVPAAEEEHKVEVDANDLLPGTSYQVKFITQNAGGTYTQSRNFSTPLVAPTVRTSEAHVTTTTANLSGSINPNGAEVTYHFEYGPGFSQSSPTKSIFAGTVPVAVNFNITGLAPATEYQFRLVAENSAGEGKSSDKTFTTQAESATTCPNEEVRVGPSAALPDCRAYELVNPPGTDWSDIVRVWPGSDDGTHISYLTLVPPEIANSAVVASSFLSSRTDAGWTTKDINLRVKYVYGLDVSLPSCFSSDYTHAIIDSPATIDENDQDAGAHDYARIEVGNPIGEPLSYGPILPDKQRGFPPTYVGGSPDLSRIIFFMQSAHLSPDTPISENALYSHDATGIHVVSLDTEHHVLPEVRPVGSNCATRENNSRNGSSADGSKVFYAAGFGGGGTIYRNDLDTGEILAVTQSHKTGETSNPGNGGFQFASPDGNIVYFTSGEQLTDDATPGGGLYRYEASTDTLEQITPFLGIHFDYGFQGAAFPSENVSRVYFSTEHRLTPDAPRGATGIYVWDSKDEGGVPGPGGPSKGTTRLITAVTDGGVSRVSANGRYMLFQSRNSIDGANNKNKTTIYMYDAVTRNIACVSCRPNGAPSQADSNLADEPESLTFGIINPRNISNDGRVFFNSSDRLIPADQTLSQDVYEYYQGSVSLISSGQGDLNQSYLADNSDDGKHVFFLTRNAFRPEDKDASELDIYDAHTDGGFPLPKPQPPACEGEACRTSTSPKPEDAAPTTPNFSGAGNTRPKRVRPKHHHHKKTHHKKKHHRKADHRGTGR
jgi:hypothetical protein